MTIVLLASLVWQVIDFLRELTAFKANKAAVITQATAWVGGIVIIALAAHTQVAANLVIPGFAIALGNLNFSDTILVGLLTSSLASSLVDTKQAIDNRDTSVKPPLLADTVPTPAPPPATP